VYYYLDRGIICLCECEHPVISGIVQQSYSVMSYIKMGQFYIRSLFDTLPFDADPPGYCDGEQRAAQFGCAGGRIAAEMPGLF
jgi:hypothetical protein